MRRLGVGRVKLGLSAFLWGTLLLTPGLALSQPDSVAAQDSTKVGSRSALVVFLSYYGTYPLSVHPTRMRLIANETLSRALEGEDHEVISYDDLEPLQREWRVRSERGLSSGFVEDIVSTFSVDRLLIANLVIYPDRLIFLARSLTTNNGMLVSAEVLEEDAGDLTGDPLKALQSWRQTLRRAGPKIADGLQDLPLTETASTLILLPMSSIGLGPGQTEVASFCLMRSLLRSGDWSVPDPSLVAFELQQTGHDLARLEAGARGELTRQFGAAMLLIPQMVSFDDPQPSRGHVIEDGDLSAGPSLLQETKVPIYMSVLVVDVGTGRVISGNGAYLSAVNPLGAFGIAKHTLVITRLKEGTDRLVRALPRIGEES